MANRIFSKLRQLLDVAITSPADKHALMYDGGASKWKNRFVTSADIVDPTVSPYPGHDQVVKRDSTGRVYEAQVFATTALTGPSLFLHDVTAGTYPQLAVDGSQWTLSAGYLAADYIGTGVVSNTEFGYLDGVTSSIQTQINGKAASSHTHDGGDIQSGQIPAAFDSAIGRVSAQLSFGGF